MSENQNKPRFNVIDLVIILAVLALIAAAVLRSGITDEMQKTEANDRAEVTVIIEGVSPSVAEAFHDGDTLYCTKNGAVFGTLDHFDTEPFVKYMESLTGELIKTESQSLITLRGTVTCKGARTQEGSFLLNGTQFISAGSTFTFRNNTTEANLTVLSVSILQD